MADVPQRQIRAQFDDTTIRVYQAYSDAIADNALDLQTFKSPPFNMHRMTWIKPSFFWMMYRANWGHKDAGQKRILAIDITRQGFEWALLHSCASIRDPCLSDERWHQIKNSSPVRIQWDPERDLHLKRLEYRTIQLGLSKEAVGLYVHEWIKNISDVTILARRIESLISIGNVRAASELAPQERPLVLSHI